MAAGGEPRAARWSGRWFRQWAQQVKVLVTVAVLGAFLYHTSLNLQSHLQQRKVIISSKETFPPPQFPPYRLCVWPSWNPRRLLSLGLNVSGLTQEEIATNYNEISGVDGQVTGRHLVEAAAWRPQDLLHEVRVGNTHEVYNSTTSFTSALWSRSFTPIGPCLTLKPPPSASQHSHTISIRFRESVDVTPCEEGRHAQHSDSKHCLDIQKHCNASSCGLHRFLTDFWILPFHYLLSSSKSIWVTGTWNELRLTNEYFVNGVVVSPFTFIPLDEDAPVNAETCFYKCLMARGAEEAKCSPLTEESWHEPISSLCVTAEKQWSLCKYFLAKSPETSYCLHHCESRQVTSRWSCALDAKSRNDESVFTIRLAKRFTLTMRETETYPVSQFLADTGGGLGLFLGVCVLDGWNLLLQGVAVRGVATRRPVTSSLRHLARITGTLVASGVTCVHLLLLVKSFLQQPETLTAWLAVAANETSNTRPLITAESLLMERMASRVLGCRVSGTARLDECVKCLLQAEHDQSLPFISVSDLPRCSLQHLGLPRLRFVVQKDYIQRIAGRKRVASCPACATLNDSRPSVLVKYVVSEDSSGSSVSLVCALGGLLGLYLGLSLLNVADLLKKSWMGRHLDAGGRCLVAAWLCLAGGAVAAAVVICVLLLHTFLAAHPVHSSTSRVSMEEDVLPSVTTCVWPPVNIQRVLETAGLGAAFADVARVKDAQERRAAIALLLQRLPQAANITDPRVLWAAGAWTEDEIYGTLLTSRGLRTTKSLKNPATNTILNRCWQYTPNSSLSRLAASTKYNFHVNLKEDTVAAGIHYLAFLHYPDEVLIPEPTLFSKHVSSVNVDLVTRWRPLEDKGDMDRGACVSRCLNSFLMHRLACRLPSAVEAPHLPPCSLAQFTQFLTTLWRVGTKPENIYEHLLGQNQTRWCRTACSHRRQTFFMIEPQHGEAVVSSGLSVATNIHDTRLNIIFVFRNGISEHMSAYDGYSGTRLVSDLGSVLGMTLGASALSLLIALVTKMSQPRTRLTKVSSLPSTQ